MKKMKTNIWVIGIGIIVFFLLAAFFGLQGFKVYPPQVFGPNFISAVVSAALGAAVSLTVVLIGFEFQRDARFRALEPARYLFLREQGEELKESYVAFIDILRIGGTNSLNLSGKSWQALKKEIWPDSKTINLVQNDINQLSVSASYNSKAVLDTYNRLRQSVESIVRMSALGVFEGKEPLIEGILWQADYNVHVLRPALNRLVAGQSDVTLTPVEKGLKDITISVGNLLLSLCKLGQNIKLR